MDIEHFKCPSGWRKHLKVPAFLFFVLSWPLNKNMIEITDWSKESNIQSVPVSLLRTCLTVTGWIFHRAASPGQVWALWQNRTEPVSSLRTCALSHARHRFGGGRRRTGESLKVAQLNPLTRSESRFCDITSSINNEQPCAEQKDPGNGRSGPPAPCSTSIANHPGFPPEHVGDAVLKKMLCPVFQYTGPAGVIFIADDAEVTPTKHPYPN